MQESSLGGSATAVAQASDFNATFQTIKEEVAKYIVSQEDVIEGVLTALIAGGHVLLEGVPGIGKTLLVRTLSEAVSMKFSRIQFTPDLMPADIQGTMILQDSEAGHPTLQFREGPLVANLVLADEINRATPKTQSALLEAMQEHQITVSNNTITLPEPYCVMATQNPVEQEGTYPLPEAQLDRFLLKILVTYPEETAYHEIIDRTTGESEPEIRPVCDADTILKMRSVARAVAVPEVAKNFAIRLVMATQPGSSYASHLTNEYVMLGSSPRGAQSLIL
ncbi:MAG: AAA family ATPase, partial [Gammaproteobacteria bacterium]|nr:AAA family ATPase [Gammaproteobacteria bacterium]